jgi:hypothetical protein
MDSCHPTLSGYILMDLEFFDEGIPIFGKDAS